MRWLRSFTSQNNEADVRVSVERLFAAAGKDDVYTLPQLVESLSIRTVDQLASALAELTRDNVVDQIFRVESPKNRGGIKDFARVEDIPDEIKDWRQGEQIIPVTPPMVRVLFRRHSAESQEVRDVHSGQ